MAEEIGFENGRNSNFEGLMTLTLTLDPVIRHTVMHHSSTSTYVPNFTEIEEIFLWTDGHFSPSNIIRSTFGSRPKYALLLTQKEGHDILTLAFNVLKLASAKHSSHHRPTVSTRLPLLAPRPFFRILIPVH